MVSLHSAISRNSNAVVNKMFARNAKSMGNVAGKICNLLAGSERFERLNKSVKNKVLLEKLQSGFA